MQEEDIMLLEYLAASGIRARPFEVQILQRGSGMKVAGRGQKRYVGILKDGNGFDEQGIAYVSNYLRGIDGLVSKAVISLPFMATFHQENHTYAGRYLGTGGGGTHEFAFGFPAEEKLPSVCGCGDIRFNTRGPRDDGERERFALAIKNLEEGRAPTFPRMNSLHGAAYAITMRQMQLENVVPQ